MSDNTDTHQAVDHQRQMQRAYAALALMTEQNVHDVWEVCEGNETAFWISHCAVSTVAAFAHAVGHTLTTEELRDTFRRAAAAHGLAADQLENEERT